MGWRERVDKRARLHARSPLVIRRTRFVTFPQRVDNAEYRSFANEDGVRAAVREGAAGPGQYVVPHVVDMKRMKEPAAAVSFLAYAGGSIQHGIWMGKPWNSVSKEVLDTAIYACITGATFAWLLAR